MRDPAPTATPRAETSAAPGRFIARLVRRPHGLVIVADLVRAIAPLSAIVYLAGGDLVEASVLMLVFGGVLLARAAALPPLLDTLTSAVLLAAAWFSVADLYAQISWIDVATHCAAGGVLGALAHVLLERWDAAPLVPQHRRVTAASVVAGALITGALALALSVAWELLEWWGHTYIDETVHVGYRDTIGDLAAGGIGGMIAGALLVLGRQRRRPPT